MDVDNRNAFVEATIVGLIENTHVAGSPSPRKDECKVTWNVSVRACSTSPREAERLASFVSRRIAKVVDND